MAETKKARAVEVIRDEKEPRIPVTETKADFKALIEAYAKRNPEKYALKKAALDAQLAGMQ